ncbi:MAG: hypothetical protein B7Z68_05845 [Acidobacteria bacterium 21-70-11]|nr:MAG: hypothetical protein B7Z68_05845 [Acidobacteria bacterium 21-70-11]HQT94176.1 hypothetical protein [Thermoanaerobaculaceae bacterium]HQU34279.1 hypothetical protein [Thermoanaerobaculaceae bacterium]
MEDRLARVEARLEALARALEDVSGRLVALESVARGEGATQRPAPPPAVPAAVPPVVPATAATVLPLLGRVFLVLGGAWLLRALTDAGTLPLAGGVTAGLAYAGVWLVLADRAGAAGRRWSAEVHGVTATLIAFPLVWEAATKFKVLSPAAAAAVLAVVAGGGLVVAARRSLAALAWAATLAGLVTAIALIAATHAIAVFAALLVALGVATVWLAYARRWFGLSWMAALVADLAVAGAVALVTQAGGPPETYRDLSTAAVEAVALALLVAYLATFAVRTLLRRRDASVFEAVQTVAALLVGFGGAAEVSRATGTGGIALGVAALATGAACYLIAEAGAAGRVGRGVNYVFYSSLALVLVLAGTPLVAASATRSALWCGLAMGGAVLGCRLDRPVMRAHAAAYLVAAGVVSGLLPFAVGAFVAAPASPADAGPTALWLTLATSMACYAALAVLGRRGDVSWPTRLPELVVAVVAALGVGGALVLAGARLLPLHEGAPDPAAMATLRSIVLAVTALGLAAAGRRAGREELVWLVYPVLALGGLKLLAQDVPQGRPDTLVLSFAAYGAALILAPRLLRRPPPPTE